MTAILIVEDDPDTQAILQAYLRTLGTEVSLAATAGEARQLIEQAIPALMVIDIGLPDDDGVSLLADLRTRTELAATRTIAVTAYSDPVTRERVLSAGFHDVLWKPIDGQDFLRAVRRQLEG